MKIEATDPTPGSAPELLVRSRYSPETATRLRALPAGRWDPHKKVWRFPATPASAANLAAMLDGHPHEVDDGASEWLAVAARSPVDRDEVRRLYAGSNDFDPVREGLSASLWRHQRAAVKFAEAGSRGRGWCSGTLFYLGLGSGKTLATLEYAKRNVGEGLAILVLCPKAVIPTWRREVERHYPGDFDVLELSSGSTDRRANALREAIVRHTARGRGRLVVVLNYDAAWRARLGEAVMSTGWALVVADEVHRLKAPGGKASRFAARLALRVPRRLGLSGTPCSHSPLDAYGVYRFLDPGVFGTSFARFRARYAIMGGFDNREVVGYQRQDEYNERFYSIAFRVDRDVLDLPDEHHIYRDVELPEAALKLYRELERDFVADLVGGVVTAAHALTRLLRLQQVTSGHLPMDAEPGERLEERRIVAIHDARKDALAEVLDEIPPDDPVVVFCRFRRDLHAVRDVADATGRRSMELSGERDDLEEWREARGGEVIAVQIQSGSEGIDLVRARYAVYYSLDFSLGRYEQSLRRVHRPGQERAVTYLHLIARGTVDESIYRALRERRDVLETILEDRAAARAEGGVIDEKHC